MAIENLTDAADIAAEEMARLWKAHGIIELMVRATRNQSADTDLPALHGPLQAVADLIKASIDELEALTCLGAIRQAMKPEVVT